MGRGAMSDRQKGILFLVGGLLCFAAAFGLVLFFSGRWKAGDPTTEAGSALRWTEPSPEASHEGGEGSVTREAAKAPWVIYITGEVKAPGVYKVEPDSRIYQVIDRAGGFTADADAVAINLARPLQDGDHIHVPARNRVVPGAPNAPQGAIQNDGAVVSRAAPATDAARIDLNHCTRSSLESLPGIGPKTAASIILFRQEHGLFRSVEDLVQVRGIGPVKMDQIRGLVTVRP